MESTTTTGQTSQTTPNHNYDPRSTDEQVTIYDWMVNGSGHAIIRARAGAGKTSTLVELAKLIDPNASTTFLAFNKHIQKELKGKLPSTVFCYTTHGLGFSAIMRKYKTCVFDPFKSDKVIQKLSKDWDLTEIENIIEYYTNMKKMINLFRLTLTHDKKAALDLCDKHNIPFSKTDVDRVFLVLERMLNDKTTCDFTDMVYLPVVDTKIWLFPQDYILIDEAQDLSKAQHELIKKAIKKDKQGRVIGRMIFVGDDMQAIYAFAGADSYSFLNLSKIPNTLVFPLTTSFRCPKAVIKLANTLVPDIRAMEDAIEGQVRMDGDVLAEAENGDFVLSRKTLPLVKLFYEFLVENKKAYIKGSDIGDSLIEFTDKQKSIAQLDATLTNKLKQYQENLKKHHIINYKEDSGYVALNDKISVLRFLMPMTKTVDDLKTRIKYIFKKDTDETGQEIQHDGIVLSTVHKAKGLEADRVFIIMPKDLPLRTGLAWQYQQEINLKYIAITRAKRELIFDNDWKVDDGTFEGFRP